MSRSMLSAITDAERRILQVLARGTATRAQIVAAAGLGRADVEHSLDTLWSSGFVECTREFFSAGDEDAADGWTYTIASRGRYALAGI